MEALHWTEASARCHQYLIFVLLQQIQVVYVEYRNRLCHQSEEALQCSALQFLPGYVLMPSVLSLIHSPLSCPQKK